MKKSAYVAIGLLVLSGSAQAATGVFGSFIGIDANGSGNTWYGTQDKNEGDRFSNNGGNNYTATFTTIPEPSSIIMMGLAGLAAAGLTLLKRRRKA